MVVLSNSDIASSKIKLKTIKTFKICKVYGKYSDEEHATLHNLISFLFELCFFILFIFNQTLLLIGYKDVGSGGQFRQEI